MSNDVEVLNRLTAPITKVYSELSPAPASGLEGMAAIIENKDFENSLTITFLHDNGGQTVVPLSPNAVLESHFKPFSGIIKSGSSTSYYIYVKELFIR